MGRKRTKRISSRLLHSLPSELKGIATVWAFSSFKQARGEWVREQAAVVGTPSPAAQRRPDARWLSPSVCAPRPPAGARGPLTSHGSSAVFSSPFLGMQGVWESGRGWATFEE